MSATAPSSLDPRIDAVFERLRAQARVFFTGNLCGMADFAGKNGPGHLHLLRKGTLRLTSPQGTILALQGPVALLFPRPAHHRLESDGGADLVCAEIELGGTANPFYWGLPELLWLPLDQPEALLESVLVLLFAEAAETQAGRQAVMNRLAEVGLIHLLRHAMTQAPGQSGLLAGLAHPQLSKALTLMHEQPEIAWTLDSLADAAGLSRSAFAERFCKIVGRPPGQYLNAWRLALAREELAKGRPVKKIAREVGYRSAAALSRAFSRHFDVDARTVKKEKAGP